MLFDTMHKNTIDAIFRSRLADRDTAKLSLRIVDSHGLDGPRSWDWRQKLASDVVQNGRHYTQLPLITSARQQTQTRKLCHQMSVGVGVRVLCTILSNSREPWSISERHHHLGSAVRFSFRPRRRNDTSFIATTMLLSRSRMQENRFVMNPSALPPLADPTRQQRPKPQTSCIPAAPGQECSSSHQLL